MTQHDTAPIDGREVRALVESLPKVELHVHLGGTATPETADELADKHGSERMIRPDGRDVGQFFPRFRQIMSLIRDQEDVSLLVRRSALQFQADNVRYAEVTVSPHGHRKSAGMSFEDVVEGLEAGRSQVRSLGVELAWIFDLTTATSIDEAWETVRLALNAANDGAPVVALGFVGVEQPQGSRPYSEVFQFARDRGLRVVAHAGEFRGPDYVREVITQLRPERIGHGTTAVKDPGLLDYLVETQTPIEVCLTSNLVTGAVSELQQHPARRLLDAGANVIFGSDDPAIFGTSLTNEYVLAATVLNLSPNDLRRSMDRSIGAAFVDASMKLALGRDLQAGLRAAQRVPEMRL